MIEMTDREFVAYCRAQAQTPRGGFMGHDMRRLSGLAGLEVGGFLDVRMYTPGQEIVEDCCERATIRLDLAAEREKSARLEAQLKNDSLGMPLARLRVIGEFAEAHCGHSTFAAKPAELTLMEAYSAMEARVAGLETILAGAEHASSCPSTAFRMGDESIGEEDFVPINGPCTCFKSLDPLKVGKAVMTLRGIWSANMENFVRGCDTTIEQDVELFNALDALVSAGTEGK